MTSENVAFSFFFFVILPNAAPHSSIGTITDWILLQLNLIPIQLLFEIQTVKKDNKAQRTKKKRQQQQQQQQNRSKNPQRTRVDNMVSMGIGKEM